MSDFMGGQICDVSVVHIVWIFVTDDDAPWIYFLKRFIHGHTYGVKNDNIAKNSRLLSEIAPFF